MAWRMNLRAQVLILITGVIALILVLSAYLHQLITRQLIEEDAYNSAVSRTVGLASRIAALSLFDDQAALDRDLRFARTRRQDVDQIDVYRPARTGPPVLASSTSPEAPRLPVLTDGAADNELGEMEKPQADVITMEVLRAGTRHWIISVAIHDRSGIGYVTSLVRKTSDNPALGSVELQHNLVLTGAMGVCVALFYFLVEQFFRRPARDIVRAMGGGAARRPLGARLGAPRRRTG